MSKRKIRGSILAVSLLAFGAMSAVTLASCDQPAVVQELTLTGETSVQVGNTITLTCNETDVTWTSSNTSVATVANGVVTPKRAGHVTITVSKDGWKNATLEVTIVSAPEENATIAGATGVAITNKEALTAAWSSTDSNRRIELSIEGVDDVNLQSAIMDGSIEITPSNSSIIVNGLYISSASYDGGEATVTVTVHGDKGDFTDTIDIKIDGIMEPMTLEEVYNSEIGSTVAFEGIVTADYSADEVYGLFIGNGEYSAFVYKGELPVGVEVGDKVYVNGKTSVYNGLYQIGTALILSMEDADVAEPVGLGAITSLDGIDGYDTGKSVELNGTISNKAIDSYGNVTFNVEIAEGVNVPVKADSRYVTEDPLAALAALEDGDTAKIGGYVTFNKSGESDLVTNADSILILNPWVIE